LPEDLKIAALRAVAMQFRQQNQVVEAIEALRALEGLVGTEGLATDELLWVARYYTELSETKKALKYLSPLLADIDNVPAAVTSEAMLLSATALRDLGQLAEAADVFREVVASGDGFGFRARLGLARIMAQRNQVEQALLAYAKLLSAADVTVQAEAVFDSAEIYRRLANKRARENDDAGAAKAREEARNLFLRLVLLFRRPQFSPLPELARVNLAEIAEEQGCGEDALSAFEELVKEHPDGAYASYGNAMIMIRQNKKNEARDLLDRLQNKELDRRLKDRVTAALKAMEALR